jgi:diguanylate cyclase
MTPPLTGKRILLVDDDSDPAEALSLYLKSCGAEVLCVFRAASALIESEHFEPDVIVSDMSMPDMDGCELIGRIRAAEKNRRLPAIALSAHAGQAYRQQALLSGFDEYLAKPIDPAVLVAALVRVSTPRP